MWDTVNLGGVADPDFVTEIKHQKPKVSANAACLATHHFSPGS